MDYVSLTHSLMEWIYIERALRRQADVLDTTHDIGEARRAADLLRDWIDTLDPTPLATPFSIQVSPQTAYAIDRYVMTVR